MKKPFKTSLLALLIACVCVSVTQAQNKVDSVLGDPKQNYRADDVPAGEEGRYYIPGAAAGKDNIFPSSFSQSFKLGADFKTGWNTSCGNLDFYQNISAEIKNLKHKMMSTVKNAQKAIMTSVSSAMSSFFQYALAKINPTLAQLSMKHLDEYIKLFEVKVKQCRDYEKDVQNGKNPLDEIVQIAVGEQWKTTVGMVNRGEVALEEAEKEIVDRAKKQGVSMADGKHYGGEGQEPINITKSLLKAGMNLIMSRADKSQWDSDFTVNKKTVKNNPILGEFKNPKALYKFIEEVYGATKTTLTSNTPSGKSVQTVAGRGYEKKYAEYRDEYIPKLRQYVNRQMDRKRFEQETGHIIPPAEVDDIRRAPPYQRGVEIEQRAQQYAIKRIKGNLIFAKQALKTGIYAPDMQQSGMKGVALREYKSIYYRIQDDLVEVSQRAYQF